MSAPKGIQKQPKKRSAVWRYIRRDMSRKTEATCLLCENVLKYHGCTTSLWSHLKTKHPGLDFSDDYDEEANASTSIAMLMSNSMKTSQDQGGFENGNEFGGTIATRNTGTRSGVWQFMRKDSPFIATCTLCDSQFKYHRATSSLWHHLKAKHRDALEGSQEDGLEIPLTPPKQAVSQQQKPSKSSASVSILKAETGEKLHAAFRDGTSKKKYLDRLVVGMIVGDLQPLTIVEQPGFQKLVNALEPKYTLPTSKQLSTDILPSLHREEKEKLKAELKNIAHVTITTEAWTSPHADSLLTVSAHYFDDQWQIKSAVLETCMLMEDSVPETVAGELSRIFTAWDLHPKVTCIVTDTSTNITTAVQILRVPHVQCYAHTLDWLIQDSMNNVPELVRLRKRVRSIVSFFHHSTSDMEKLLQLQKAEGQTPRKLELDFESRWLSTFYMLQGYVQLYDFVTNALYQTGRADAELSLSAEELAIVAHCVKTLDPFEAAVKEMTLDKYMPLCKVIPMTKAILQFIGQTTQNAGEDISGLASELELQMSRHFTNIEENFLYGASTMLDPRFKRLPFSSKEIVANIEQQLLEEILIRSEPTTLPKPEPAMNTPTTSLWSTFDQQVEYTISANPQESSIEFTRYYEELLLPRQEDGIAWWRKMGKFLTKLSPLAMKYLAIPASSLPANRLFKKHGDFVSQMRPNLNDSVVNTMLFLNKNLPAAS